MKNLSTIGWSVLTPCALALGVVFAAAAAERTTFAFTLPRDATTSAGVYDSQGRLLRTLWRANKLPAGVHLSDWDGTDDAGKSYAGREIVLKVIHHRVNPVWEGVIGNSSASLGDSKVHRAFHPPSSLLPIAGKMYYAVGYNEWQPGIHGFSLSAPQADTRPIAATDDAFVSHSMLTSDGTRLYWANTGGVSRTSFVGAFNLATAQRSEFTRGKSICLNFWPNSSSCYPGQFYKSVINLRTDIDDIPTGIAVQRSGRILAVAHGTRNLIRLLDKTTGDPLKEITVPLIAKSVNQLAMSPGGDLWVISGKAVLRYTDLEGSPKIKTRIDAAESPLALGTAEAGDDGVWVADGGASHQLKKFDASGKLVTVIGLRGGYATDPKVADDKLCFQAPGGKEQTAVGVAADASVWVVDYCNNRMLRFRPQGVQPGRSDDQIAYIPASYLSTVDHSRPQRVFANFLEFEVDRNAPLQPGKSWKLVRNWLAGLPPSLIDDRAYNAKFGGLTSVETLSNGRTYGLIQAKGRQVIVELPASGPLRIVKTLAQPVRNATAWVMYENGDLGYALTSSNSQSAMRQTLKGFDAAGDPLWSTDPVLMANVPTLPDSPHYRGAFSGMPPRFPVTASGNVVFFDQSVEGNEGFHLGASRTGGTGWLWQSSPTGPLDGKGSFQTKRIDQSINYGGNAVWAHGRHIIYGYHGEFYKDLQTGKVGQANQFMHYDESGLFIGQFGQSSTRPAPANLAGLSGNAFSPTLVRDGPRLYLYHNDESSHGGVHRWRIDGWDDIVELNGRGSPGSEMVLE